jgi:hypothetical protein
MKQFDKNYIVSKDELTFYVQKHFAYFEDTYLSFVAKEKQIPFKVVKLPLIHFGKQTSSLIGIQDLYLTAKEKFTNVWKDRAKKIPKMVVV